MTERCAGRQGRGVAARRRAVSGHARRPTRQRGAYAVEFLLVLVGSLSLFVPMAEFMRLSLFDQALARATHQAARAAASPQVVTCQNRVTEVYQGGDGETLIGWLFDANDDGQVDVRFEDGWPAVGGEVRVAMSGSANAGGTVGPWSWHTGCGPGGSVTVLRTRIVVPGWSLFAQTLWPDGFAREHVSWAAG